ncbi:MAG: methyltransferase domain-containing protein [Saprospirales bacterium]|nr:methyltransferase domain-containing protein [Saprospirales bacterium]
MERKQLIDYYEKTRFDYRVAWLDRANPAIHFGYYDEKARVHKDALFRLNEVMADLASIGPECRVLDAGCGLGASALWLAKNRGAQVTGINLVSGQVSAASKLAEKNGLEGLLQFVQADYHQTPFPDESFEVVWACESLCHSPDKRAFYREAFRVLRPGGRLVMAEYIRSARPLDLKREALLADWLSGWAIPDIDTPEEHSSNALEAGFAGIEIKDVTAHTRVSHRNLYKHGRKWWRLGQALTAIGIRSRIEKGNHRGAIRQFEALEEKAWFYGLGLAKKAENV